MAQSDAERIRDLLSEMRLGILSGEYELHEIIARKLSENGFEFTHEAPLGKGKRVDFLVKRTAIEVKKGKPAPSELKRQVSSYLASDKVDDIVVVVKRAVKLPATIGGKRVFIVSLDRLWGISLP